MRLWLLLIGVLLLQELASTNIVLLAAHRAGFSAALITLVFLAATAFDLAVGYWLGKWLQRRFSEHRLVKKSEQWARRFERYLGPWSERVTLVLIGFVSFAYVNAFLSSWLAFSTAEAITCLALGDFLWYALEWVVVRSAESVSGSFSTELYLVVGFSIVFIIAIRFVANGIFRA